jgi:hypothetical protein
MIGCCGAAGRFALRQDICEQAEAVGFWYMEFVRSLEQPQRNRNGQWPLKKGDRFVGKQESGFG